MLKILITGGAGSLGQELVKHFYNQGYEVTALFRTPQKQYALKQKYPNLKIILTDICNSDAIRQACRGQDILIHAAALKQIDVGEYHPEEFTRVNAWGSQVVAQAWYETGPLRPAILVSTDKACSPINLYGATKKISESVFRYYNFSVLRYGNVISSEGSFIHKWKGQKTVQVRQSNTGETPTRFVVQMHEAVAMLSEVIEEIGDGGKNGIFVPSNLRAFNVYKLADWLSLKVELTSILAYEKLHEVLVAPGEGVEPATFQLNRIIAPDWSPIPSQYESNRADKMDRIELVGIVKEIWG